MVEIAIDFTPGRGFDFLPHLGFTSSSSSSRWFSLGSVWVLLLSIDLEPATQRRYFCLEFPRYRSGVLFQLPRIPLEWWDFQRQFSIFPCWSYKYLNLVRFSGMRLKCLQSKFFIDNDIWMFVRTQRLSWSLLWSGTRSWNEQNQTRHSSITLFISLSFVPTFYLAASVQRGDSNQLNAVREKVIGISIECSTNLLIVTAFLVRAEILCE